MFSKVLVANRGEIALRILRTLDRMAVRHAVVYNDSDVESAHVRRADEAWRIGPASLHDSYLNVDAIIQAAIVSGADAIHPGYGFLSESASLASACDTAGITFIGPSANAIAAMGDKIRARDMAHAAGVPVVPGRSAVGLTDDAITSAVLEIGLPVLLKPSAGGGGKGMRLVEDLSQLTIEVASSRREALAAFGDDTLLIERFVAHPRHIEVQVAADQHGAVVHIGERECSLQRRHQKIIEECPSPFIGPTVRAAMGEAAIEVARACAYTNVGTVELIVSGDDPEQFFFMEMNTRLQVEHPVTEEAYGVDLVELQLRLAAGEPLPWRQEELRPLRHAIEARIYAEDPAAGFLPTGGTIEILREPSAPQVRVDAGWQEGDTVGSTFDPMLAKVIAYGESRVEALETLRSALERTVVLGVTTNTAFLADLLDVDEVRSGRLDTGLVARYEVVRVAPPAEVVAAAWLLLLSGDATDPWSDRRGWRLGDPVWIVGRLDIEGESVDVRARSDGSGWLIALGDAEPEHMTLECNAEERSVVVCTPRRRVVVLAARQGPHAVAAHALGRAWRVEIADRVGASGGTEQQGLGEVASPMPGSVIAVLVDVGLSVVPGQALVVVEAMKMEHAVAATHAAVVGAVHVSVGDQVALRQPLVTLEPVGGST